MGCLYLLEFPNGKGYVGISRMTAENRFEGHKHPRNTKTLCGRAIHKYGPDKIKIHTLASKLDWEALCLAEQLAIEAYNTRSPAGYNMTSGGDGVVGHSDALRAKISDNTKVLWRDPAYRATRSAQTKAQWEDPAFRATVNTPKHRAAQSVKSTAMWADPEFRKGQEAKRPASIAKMKATKAKRLLFYWGARDVRVAYGQCLAEKRPCSLIE